MSNSASGGPAERRPELSTRVRQELIGLRMIWEHHYAINVDGPFWTALHVDNESAVIQASSSEELRSLIRKDNTARAARRVPGGAWTANASGADYRHPASQPAEPRLASVKDLRK